MLEPAKRRVLQRVRGELNVERLVAQGLELGPRTYIGHRVYLDAGHPWLISIGAEDVPLAVELRDGDPMSELSQGGEAATSGAAVVMGV